MREMSSLNKEEEKRGQKKRKKEEEKLIRGKTKRKIEEEETYWPLKETQGSPRRKQARQPAKVSFTFKIKSRMDKLQNGWSLNKVKIVES